MQAALCVLTSTLPNFGGPEEKLIPMSNRGKIKIKLELYLILTLDFLRTAIVLEIERTMSDITLANADISQIHWKVIRYTK